LYTFLCFLGFFSFQLQLPSAFPPTPVFLLLPSHNLSCPFPLLPPLTTAFFYFTIEPLLLPVLPLSTLFFLFRGLSFSFFGGFFPFPTMFYPLTIFKCLLLFPLPLSYHFPLLFFFTLHVNSLSRPLDSSLLPIIHLLARWYAGGCRSALGLLSTPCFVFLVVISFAYDGHFVFLAASLVLIIYPVPYAVLRIFRVPDPGRPAYSAILSLLIQSRFSLFRCHGTLIA